MIVCKLKGDVSRAGYIRRQDRGIEGHRFPRLTVKAQSAGANDLSVDLKRIYNVEILGDVGEESAACHCESAGLFRVGGKFRREKRGFQLVHAAARSSVGENKSVDAEVSVVRGVSEIAAVGIFYPSVGELHRNGMVAELPHAAAEERVMLIESLPVFFEVAGAVAHCVAVLAEEERLGDDGIFGIVLHDLVDLRVHEALDVGITAPALFLFCRVVGMEILLNSSRSVLGMDKAGGVAAAEIIAHKAVVHADAAFVSDRPHYDRRVVLVTLKQALCAVEIGGCPVGVIGEAVPVCCVHRLTRAAHLNSVRLDVSLVTDVYSEEVAECGEPRVVRIMRGADGVYIVCLHYKKVAEHMVKGNGVTEDRMAVVAVNALCLEFSAVEQDGLVLHVDPAQTDGKTENLVSGMEIQGIKLRPFVIPEYGGGDPDNRSAVSRAFADNGSVGGGEAEGNGEIFRFIYLKLQRRFGQILGNLRADKHVFYVFRVAEEEECLAEDAGHSPHILILKIRAVAPLGDNDADLVASGGDKVGYLDLGRAVAYLAVCLEFAVYPEVECRINALEVDIHPLFRLLRGKREKAPVKSAGDVVRDMRRITGDGVIDIRILRDVVFHSVFDLPAAGNGDFLIHCRKFCVRVGYPVDGREPSEVPLSAEALEICRPFPAASGQRNIAVGDIFGLIRNKIRPRCLTADMLNGKGAIECFVEVHSSFLLYMLMPQNADRSVHTVLCPAAPLQTGISAAGSNEVCSCLQGCDALCYLSSGKRFRCAEPTPHPSGCPASGTAGHLHLGGKTETHTRLL